MWDNRKRKLPAALLQREQPDTQLRRAGPGQGADLGTAPGSPQHVPLSPWFSAARPPQPLVLCSPSTLSVSTSRILSSRTPVE